MHSVTNRHKASRKKFDCLIRYTLFGGIHFHFFVRGKSDHIRVIVMHSMKHLCDKILFRASKGQSAKSKKIHNGQ